MHGTVGKWLRCQRQPVRTSNSLIKLVNVEIRTMELDDRKSQDVKSLLIGSCFKPGKLSTMQCDTFIIIYH